jgi:hypothetical protein
MQIGRPQVAAILTEKIHLVLRNAHFEVFRQLEADTNGAIQSYRGE